MEDKYIVKCYENIKKMWPEIFNRNQNGKLDNFLFEDDVEVILEIPMQPIGYELKELDLLLEGNQELIKFEFLPFGEFEHSGVICIDTKAKDEKKMKVIWFDHEECCRCISREEYEAHGLAIFDNFTQLLECFFLGIVHDCATNINK